MANVANGFCRSELYYLPWSLKVIKGLSLSLFGTIQSDDDEKELKNTFGLGSCKVIWRH